jgi:hypothetical protein
MKDFNGNDSSLPQSLLSLNSHKSMTMKKKDGKLSQTIEFNQEMIADLHTYQK